MFEADPTGKLLPARMAELRKRSREELLPLYAAALLRAGRALTEFLKVGRRPSPPPAKWQRWHGEFTASWLELEAIRAVLYGLDIGGADADGAARQGD